VGIVFNFSRSSFGLNIWSGEFSYDYKVSVLVRNFMRQQNSPLNLSCTSSVSRVDGMLKFCCEHYDIFQNKTHNYTL
jgi:hypothetical protein